ncbi:MAG: hypothetical protein ABR505_03995 [Actinomycetota bacterium]
MSRLRVVVVVLTLLCASCRSDEITLSYRFSAGTTTEYLMRANATAEWDIGGGGGGTSSLLIRVRETVEKVEAGNATMEVSMFPQEASGAGLLAPGAERRSFKLRVGTDGGVQEVLEINGIPARVLRPEERTLIGTFRVPLPAFSVGLFDTWAAPLGVGSEVGLGGTEIRGTLERLDTEIGRQTAHLSYSGRGPLSWTVSLPQGRATLNGEALTDITAKFDIAGGFLTSAESTTSGTFELRVARGRAQAPLSGSLSFVLDLEIVRSSEV